MVMAVASGVAPMPRPVQWHNSREPLPSGEGTGNKNRPGLLDSRLRGNDGAEDAGVTVKAKAARGGSLKPRVAWTVIAETSSSWQPSFPRRRESSIVVVPVPYFPPRRGGVPSGLCQEGRAVPCNGTTAGSPAQVRPPHNRARRPPVWGFQRRSHRACAPGPLWRVPRAEPLGGESREGSALSGRTGPVSVTGGENNPFTTRIGL